MGLAEFLDHRQGGGDVRRRYWNVALSGAKVNGNWVSLGATTAIMDSGTTAILVSATDAAAIHAVCARYSHSACLQLFPTLLRQN